MQIPRTQPYARVQIPVETLIGGSLDPTLIREIEFSMTGMEADSGAVYFDEIMFVAAEVPLTPFEQWLQDNNVDGAIVEIDGTTYTAMALYTMGATREPGGDWRDILRIESLTLDDDGRPILIYPEIDDRSYSVWWNDDLSNPNGWQEISDINDAPVGNLIFYRIQVEMAPQP